LSQTSLTRAGLVRAAWHLTPPILIVILISESWSGLWRAAWSPDSFFGGDLPAYVEAAKRLVLTGTPYSDAVINGQIGRGLDDIPIGYLYPPLLGQLFVPLRNLDLMLLAVIWAVAQAIVLGWLLVAVSAAARGRFDRKSAAAALGLAIASYPVQVALYDGNVSGWIAAAVALMLLGSSRVAGAAATLAAVIKVIPTPLALAALAAAGTRRSVAFTGVLVVAGSVLVSPAAWSTWWSVLPHFAPLEPDGLSPGSILRETSLAGVATIIGLALGVAFAIAAVLRAHRVGLDRPAVALAAGGYLLASTTLWDHYLAVLVPLMVATWPAAIRWQRAAIVLGAITQAMPWFWGTGSVVASLELAGALIVLIAAAYPGRPSDRQFVMSSSVGTGAP
jgi:hypothetical protein